MDFILIFGAGMGVGILVFIAGCEYWKSR